MQPWHITIAAKGRTTRVHLGVPLAALGSASYALAFGSASSALRACGGPLRGAPATSRGCHR